MASSRLLATLVGLVLFGPTFAPAQDTVTFRRQNAGPGENSRQRLSCDLDLTMAIRQGGQVVQEQQQAIQRRQERDLTILDVGPAGPRKAEVTYRESVIELKAAGAPAATAQQQPVTGKTYHVTRTDQTLDIRYPNGETPSEEELTIVTDNMNTFGLPNPIGQFFDGRQVRVGETLELPPELARELLGFAETAETVSAFHLKLASVRPARGGQAAAAVFEIRLKAADGTANGVSMNLNGQLVLETTTCRSLAVSLQGPVVATETHGPEQATYEVHTQGDLRVAVQASYQTQR